MKYFFYIFFIFISSTFPQNSSLIINGKIVDSNSLQPIIWAKIISIDSTIFSKVNLDGYFSITLNSNTNIVKFEAVGYKPKCLFLPNSFKNNFLIKLVPSENHVTCTNPPMIISKEALNNQRMQKENGRKDANINIKSNIIVLLQKDEINNIHKFIAQNFSLKFKQILNKNIYYINSYNKVMLKYLEHKHGKLLLNALNFINWHYY